MTELERDFRNKALWNFAGRVMFAVFVVILGSEEFIHIISKYACK